MVVEHMRKLVPFEEFDYQTLLHALSRYARPRDKITDLLRRGVIIRIKKGLYIFGENVRKGPYSRELLANLIYGPSYISLEYGLQYYGLIPERVEAATSVTCGRSRKFFTPVGLFAYRMIPLEALRVGMDRIETGDGRSFLIAVPEKALADKIQSDRGIALGNRKDIETYLFEDLRLEPEAMRELSLERLGEYAERYRSGKILRLTKFVKDLKKGPEEKKHA